MVFEAGIDPEDVTVEALGTDIVLRVAGTTDTISILYMIFNGDVEGGGSPDSGVDEVRFADSTVWSAEQILTMATSYEGETINGISGLYPEGGDGDDEIISQGRLPSSAAVPATILSPPVAMRWNPHRRHRG